MLESYSKKDRLSSRKGFYTFTLADIFSVIYTFASVASLYLVNLNVNNSILGLYSSFAWLGLSFMPIALIIHKNQTNIVSIYKRYYIYCAFILMFSLFVMIDHYLKLNIFKHTSLIYLIFMFVFFVGRGIGLSVQNPILNELSEGSDKGEFLGKIQIQIQMLNMFYLAILVFVLRINSSEIVYIIFFSIGILGYFLKAYLLKNIKEPKTPPITGFNIKNMIDIIKHDSIKQKFLLITFISFFMIYFSYPFFLPYAKKVYHFNDSFLSFLTFLIYVGAMLVSFLISKSIDRVGPKPLMILGTYIYIIMLILNFLFHKVEMGYFIMILTFLFIGIGKIGFEISSQNYFFRTVKPENQLDMNIVYNFVVGIAVTLGAFSGGKVLDYMIDRDTNISEGYNLFFILNMVLIIIAIYFQNFLDRVDSEDFVDSLVSMLHPMKFIALTSVTKLQKEVGTLEEEEEVIKKIGESKNKVLLKDLLKLIDSPLFTVKTEALSALEKISVEKYDKYAIQVLLAELRKRPKGVAFIIARILGNIKKSVYKEHCIQELKNIVFDAKEKDELLKSRALLSLGKLEGIHLLNDYDIILEQDKNKYIVLVYLIRAIKDLNAMDCIHPLLFMLNYSGIQHHPNIDDEIIVSIAFLLKIEKKFYKKYIKYLSSPKEVLEEISDVSKDTALVDNFYNIKAFYKALLKNRDVKIKEYLLQNIHIEKIRLLILIYMQN